MLWFLCCVFVGFLWWFLLWYFCFVCLFWLFGFVCLFFLFFWLCCFCCCCGDFCLVVVLGLGLWWWWLCGVGLIMGWMMVSFFLMSFFLSVVIMIIGLLLWIFWILSCCVKSWLSYIFSFLLSLLGGMMLSWFFVLFFFCDEMCGFVMDWVCCCGELVFVELKCDFGLCGCFILLCYGLFCGLYGIS